ncbi:hypothetical protein F511_19792 [Dorcoceras hygrometricum]|uniref:CCHC-type domain-containing protein n=1 Tax=Dorcoceras hygrometricum TaxID=472368 RepID=A0A2Z7AXB0_9LAMI|nr:hypothetical protein F511_19792 [Dorcoceras hygrometricum]
MATTFIVNVLKVNFESVLSMEHARMMNMFQSLEESGLKGFLGVLGSVYEGSLIEFFSNAKGTANKKKDMKVECPLLHDIVAKSLCAKAGSFDVVTTEKLEMMVTIGADLKVNWGHILFHTLVVVVYMPSYQSQGFAVPLSFMLAKRVKADLGESVALHPLKVLNNRSVLTYMKNDQAVPKLNKPDKEASEKKKLVKDKVVKQKKEAVIVVNKQMVAGSQATPAKSKSDTSSDEDTRPLAKLGAAKKDGPGAKRKLVLDPSDSESTVSLPLLDIKKNQRMKRPKLMKPTADDKAKSNPGPIPDIQLRLRKFPLLLLKKQIWSRIDPAAKGKDILEAFVRPNPVEEHCLLRANRGNASAQVYRYQPGLPLLVPESSAAGCILDNSTEITWDEILAIEHRAHEEEQPTPEAEETARIEQQALEYFEELSHVLHNVEETEAEAEAVAVNSQEHQAQEEEHQAQAAEHQAQEDEQPAHEQQAQEEPAQEAEQEVDRLAQAGSSHSCPSHSRFYVHSSALVRNNEDRQGPSAKICCVERGIQSLVLGDQLMADTMTECRLVFSVGFVTSSRDSSQSDHQPQQPQVAQQSDRQRFRPHGQQFKKKSGSGSSGSGSSSSSGSRVEFCGFCGGKHSSTQCVGVQGSCNLCGQYVHFSRVCPSAGSQQIAAQPQVRGGQSRGCSPQFQ